MFNPYVKAFLGAVAAAVAALAVGIQDGHLTTSEVVIAISAFVAGITVVWSVGHPTLKWLSGAVIAGLSAFSAAVLDDAISYADWITIAGAVVGALVLIYGNENAPEPPQNPQPVAHS